MKITAIVPVKGKSERVENKNTRKFCDTNLLELKLNHLENVSNLNKIVVSSENEDILKYAKSRNFEIHKRNKYYSTSKIPMSEVYRHLAKEINTDVIAWINVTNPLAETKFYEEAIACYKNLDHIKYDCLLSAYEMKENFFYKNKPINFKPSPWPRSQDLNPLYSLSFVINLLTREQMIKWGSCVGNRPFFFIKDKLSSWDIDDMIDFKFCEFIYSKKEFTS
tara:strand:+ start:132 stop:797 length:666 start_codon:yes stop_codon:yes gene_type:complete